MWRICLLISSSFLVCSHHGHIPELNLKRCCACCPTSYNQQWSLFVCVERCWKECGIMGKKEGEAKWADEIWLAGSTRMSHSTSSRDLELRSYSGLRWHVCVCGFVRVHKYAGVQMAQTNSWSHQIFTAAQVCVLEKNKSSVVTKPQHRSQIYTRILTFCFLLPSATPLLCKLLQFWRNCIVSWQFFLKTCL